MPDDLLGRWSRHWLYPLGALLLACKLFFAASLDLYSDEIFYWLESTRPALAYSDLPFMSALLAGIGPYFWGNSALAVRLPFFLIGSALPFIVYWLAKPFVGRQGGREAAMLCLCLPLAGSMGLLAVPDAPMLAIGLLALGFFLRAQATDSLSSWVITGGLVALGFCTHYRFALFPAGVALFIAIHPPARKLLRDPKALFAAAIGLLGLIPVITFNFHHDMASAAFYFAERHPWQFDPAGLLHVPTQALLSTPPLYALLLFTGYKLSRANTAAPRLFFCVAACHLVTFAALAPWTDPTSTTIHWPLAGYLPLLVFAPSSLRSSFSALARINAAVRTVVIFGLAGTLLALVGVGSQSLSAMLQPWLGTQLLSSKMAGWPAFVDTTSDWAQIHFSSPPLIVTDNYYGAAQFAFGKPDYPSPIFTLDSDKARRDGRAQQLALWQMDSAALVLEQGAQALFITEDSTLNVDQKRAVVAHACQLGRDIAYLGHSDLLNGAKRYAYYSLTIGKGVLKCAQPARTWIDAPEEDEVIGDSLEVAGWAFAEGVGVASLEAIIEGVNSDRLVLPMPAEQRELRSDVAVIEGAERDPFFPQIGFRQLLDVGRLPPGRYTLQLRATNSAGEASLSLARQFVREAP